MKEILIKVRALLSDPKKWTQRHFAKDNDGIPCSALSNRAHCFCLAGAIEHVARSRDIADDIFSFLTTRNQLFSLSRFNDSHTHEEVLYLLDTTISSL